MFTLNIKNEVELQNINSNDSSYEERKHLYRFRANFLCYCHSFQRYDMYLEKSLEEIKKIASEIVDNAGLTKNGEIFNGTYDYLCKDVSLNTLRDTIKFLEQEKQITKLSLNEFINYCTDNSYYD